MFFFSPLLYICSTIATIWYTKKPGFFFSMAAMRQYPVGEAARAQRSLVMGDLGAVIGYSARVLLRGLAILRWSRQRVCWAPFSSRYVGFAACVSSLAFSNLGPSGDGSSSSRCSLFGLMVRLAEIVFWFYGLAVLIGALMSWFSLRLDLSANYFICSR